MYKLAIIHILICLLYGLLGVRKNREEAVARFLIIFFLPGAGLLLLLITNAFKHTAEKNAHDLELESELLKLGKESRIFRKADLEKEMNIVPVEEILLVNDTSTRRKMLIDALKEQTIWQIRTLETALQNEDSETVHYAAAALTEMRRKLQLQLQDLSVKYEEDKQNLDVLKAYANVLKTYLGSTLLDERTTLKYTYTYSFVLESLLEVYQEEATYFVEKINCELASKSFDTAKAYCDWFHQAHPDNDLPYVMSLKLYYTLRRYDDFTAELKRLKSSPVRVSHNTLMIIRHWSQHEMEQEEELASEAVHAEYEWAFQEVAAGLANEESPKEMGDCEK
ncbi:hypothetical protein P9578_09495 [Brevibacillus choshinensis]|uniref:hypothetical protein n=1 Tax=Brevibacillus choshinensis TaxID=54911 RepID=UPI002E1B9C59|nr:hypothetical protein [Brevibacillus choshinensis]